MFKANCKLEGSANKIVIVNPFFVTKDSAMEIKMMANLVLAQMNVQIKFA